MADLKISQLSDGGNAQAADEFVVARSGANYRIDGASVAAAATSVGTLSSLTVSGTTTFGANLLSSSSAAFIGANTSDGADSATVTIGGGGDGNSTRGAYVLMAGNESAATGNIEISSGNVAGSSLSLVARSTTSPMLFYSGGTTERMRLDASGNLGLGVTPSAWNTAGGFKALQVGNGSLSSNAATTVYVSSNFVSTSTGDKYISTGAAGVYAQSSGAHVWYSAASGTAGTAITFTQAMTLDASGNLLLGATANIASTRQELVMRGANGAVVSLGNNTDADRFQLASDSGANALINNKANTPMIFYTNNTERARITSGGYFKASNDGTYVDSGSSVHELRSTTTDTVVARVTHNAASPYGMIIGFSGAAPDNNTNYFLSCRDNASGQTDRCIIYSDGDLANHDGVYGTISDERLKQDIVDAGSQWNDLKAVRFRKYRMKTDVAADENAPFMLGVVAQEIEQTSPGLVDEHPDFEEQEVTDEDGNVTTERVQVGTTKTVKSSILLMKAAVALQEAMARIEALEARLEALEA
jgi:hypothetical protein